MEASKGNHLYITFITIGAPLEKLHSKGKMKRKISEMMTVYRKEASMSTKAPN